MNRKTSGTPCRRAIPRDPPQHALHQGGLVACRLRVGLQADVGIVGVSQEMLDLVVAREWWRARTLAGSSAGDTRSRRGAAARGGREGRAGRAARARPDSMLPRACSFGQCELRADLGREAWGPLRKALGGVQEEDAIAEEVAEVVPREHGHHHEVGSQRCYLVLEAQRRLVGAVADDRCVDGFHRAVGREAPREPRGEALLDGRELARHEGIAVDGHATASGPRLQGRAQEALAVHGDEQGPAAVLGLVDEEAAGAGDEGVQVARVERVEHAVDRMEVAQVELGEASPRRGRRSSARASSGGAGVGRPSAGHESRRPR